MIMDREKLENAADIASDNAVFDSNPWNIFNDGFIKGAEWLMDQPLSERLTEEEWEEYQELRLYANYAYHWGKSPVVCKKCGNLNPSGYICATCGWDNTYDPDEED